MVLEFEKPIADLEQKLQEMKELAKGRNIDLSKDIQSLEGKILALKKETFDNLTRWQRVQLSRHADRPYALDYIYEITNDFIELHEHPQESKSKTMPSVWPSRQRARLAILKLLPEFKLFAAAVTDGIQARQHARCIRPHMTTPPFKRRWPLSQRL